MRNFVLVLLLWFLIYVLSLQQYSKFCPVCQEIYPASQKRCLSDQSRLQLLALTLSQTKALQKNMYHLKGMAYAEDGASCV